MLLRSCFQNISNPDISYLPPLFQFIIISHLEIWNTHVTSLPTSILQCSLLSVWQLNELSPVSSCPAVAFQPWQDLHSLPFVKCLQSSSITTCLAQLHPFTFLPDHWIQQAFACFKVFRSVCLFSRMLFLSDTCPCPTSDGMPGEPLSHFHFRAWVKCLWLTLVACSLPFLPHKA